MPIALCRIDDRLIHGQVVVGWGKPLGIGFILVVDDTLAASDWEQELYRMGAPPGMDVFFATIDDASRTYDRYAADARPGILLTGDATSMLRLVERVPSIRDVNIGGIHHRADRVQKLRYVFLTPEEEHTLQAIEARGLRVTAQDLPSAQPLPLAGVIRGASGPLR